MKSNHYLTTRFSILILSLCCLYSALSMAQVTVSIGANDGSNGTFDYPCPLQDFYYASRAQYLYTAADLNAMGITPGSVISEIGWVVDTSAVVGHLSENYSIFLLNTTISSLSLNSWETGALQVYGPTDYAYMNGYAGNVMFPVTPFYYSGGNLVVEVCGGIASGGYTLNPACHWTDSLPYIASHQWRQDVINGCGSNDPTNFATETNRPVLVVTYTPGNFGGPTIEGDVYYDFNQNGARDTGEIGIPNHFVSFTPPGYYGFTDANGHYKFYCDTNTYSLSWVNVSPWTLTSLPAAYSISVPPDSAGNDFGIWAPPADVEYTQLVGYYRGMMRCNSLGHCSITARNTGLYSANGKISLILSSNLPFDSSYSTTGFSVSGDTVNWSYGNLLPGLDAFYDGFFHNGPAGDTVTFTYIDSVFDVSWNFQRVYSNSFTCVLSCAVDPNDKSVDPAGETAAHYTLMNQELMYTIRFQNTGNDTAFNVMILDTLDANLDLSTLQLLANSHPVSLQVAPGGVMRFSFQNIQLPDSNVNEPGSHGYVVYSVKPQNNLMDGTVINNTAYIIFDMNAPVNTNTTYNTMVLSIPTGIKDVTWNGNNYIYPNPVTNEATIFIDGQPAGKHWISIYNSVGERLLSATFTGNQYLLKEKLPEGIYMFSITDDRGTVIYSSRFVRE